MDYMDDANTVEKKLMRMANENRIPINGSIELLPLCNMNCDMCYVRLSNEEMKAQGRLRTADEWIDIGKQMKEAGVLFLLLTGGEPLLYPEFEKVYIELQKMGMILTINTNGTLIDEKWADFFMKHKPRRINITLYGCDNKTYEELCHYPNGYDKVIHAVKLLNERNVDVKLSCSLAKSNQNDFERIIQIGEDLGVPVRVDTYMMPASRERNKPFNEQSRLDPITAARCRIQALKLEMKEDLFNQFIDKSLFEVEYIVCEEGYGKMKCNAGNCSFTINWQGNVRPCVIMSTPSVSVFDHGFINAWNMIKDTCHQIKLSPKCNSCNKKTLCRTCAASALLETGSYEGTPEYMCLYTDESLRLIKEYKNSK